MSLILLEQCIFHIPHSHLPRIHTPHIRWLSASCRLQVYDTYKLLLQFSAEMPKVTAENIVTHGGLSLRGVTRNAVTDIHGGNSTAQRAKMKRLAKKNYRSVSSSAVSWNLQWSLLYFDYWKNISHTNSKLFVSETCRCRSKRVYHMWMVATRREVTHSTSFPTREKTQ